MINKLLLIIDPQIDFINGTLPVAGAEVAMNALAEYLGSHGKDYAHIIVTADRHPMRHCSFKSQGGSWPAHCVADSVGAAIWPAVMNRLLDCPDKVTVLHKGEDILREEYSILKNISATETILDLLKVANINQIDLCGLAGDVCVADTLRDAVALRLPQKINVLTRFSPSIDGGNTLDSLIYRFGL